MVDKVFSVSGNKISSMIIDERSLKFSSQRFNSIPDFHTGWAKKLTLAKSLEIKYGSIYSIRKEDNHKTVFINYKTWAGIPGVSEFSFVDNDDCELFFAFLE